MCLSPTLIRNPNKGRKDRYAHLVDNKSDFIPVPCGHCTECIFQRQSSIVQRCEVEGLNNHLFYFTLTYNQESLPIMTLSNGREIRFADIRDIQLMFKRLKKTDAFGRKFKYLYVSELGSERARPHFHGVISVVKYPKDTYADIMHLEKVLFDSVLLEWRRNYGSKRCPDYRPLCTYIRRLVRGRLSYTYDLHYINSQSKNGVSDVPFYVTKYMFKPNKHTEKLQQALKLNLCIYDEETGNILDDSEYRSVWSIVKPRFHASINFGMSDTDYVRSCIETSKGSSLFPRFYNPSNGYSVPLSKYYRRKGVLTIEDAEFFNTRNPEKCIPDERPLFTKEQKFLKLDKSYKIIEKNDVSHLFTNLIYERFNECSRRTD